MVNYLAAADALVMPGMINGLNASPLKLFEYAAMARPIVADDAPAMREILGDDGARYFPPGDDAALCAALDAVRRDPPPPPRWPSAPAPASARLPTGRAPPHPGPGQRKR